MARALAIRLTPTQTQELNLPDDCEYVRSAFYLGLPYMEIMNRVKHECFADERNSIIKTALFLGIRDEDKVYYTTTKG